MFSVDGLETIIVGGSSGISQSLVDGFLLRQMLMSLCLIN
jgi:hypothetical protein